MKSCCPCFVLEVSGGTAKIAVAVGIDARSKQLKPFGMSGMPVNGRLSF
jgi:hypothetical protein